MILPADFQFSQNNLQDYVDCARRFELRHLIKLAWPAPQTDPVRLAEEDMRLGNRFHHLVHQHHIGLTATTLEPDEPRLQTWWQGYLDHAPHNLPGQHLPEFTLGVPFGNHRLVAKFDLLCLVPGESLVIVDWKTSQRRPSRSTLQERMQTKLYRLLLLEGGSYLNEDQPVRPDQIKMIYWFANDPQTPEKLDYSLAQAEADRAEIRNRIEEICHLCTLEQPFPLTLEERRCAYCNYRSLCNRGKRAGDDTEFDDWELLAEPPITLDFDQIGEIAF